MKGGMEECEKKEESKGETEREMLSEMKEGDEDRVDKGGC